MQGKVDVKSLTKAISQVKNLTGGEHVTLYVDKKGLNVAGSGKGTSVSLTLAAEETKDGVITVGFDLLTQTLKGRKTVTLSLTGNQLIIKEGRYKGELTTLPTEEVEVKSSKAEPIKITSENQKTLSAAIDLVSLNNIYTDDPMYVWVICTKKALTVTCFDDFHMAHYHNTAASLGQINFQLSLQTFKTLNALSNGKAYKLELADGTLTAHNDLFKAVMPLTQAGEHMSAEMVKDYLSALKPEGFFSVSLDKFRTLLENASAAYDGQSTPLTIRPSKKAGLELAIDGNFAKIKETVEATHKMKDGVSVDPKLLADILTLVKEKDVRIDIAKAGDNKSLTVKTEQGPITVVYATTLV
jgi:hypothetical protein